MNNKLPNTKNNILYLSYDGMTDALGESQVLSYLCGLSKNNNKIIVISFEKKENFLKHGTRIKQVCEENKIIWNSISYTKKPPVFSTIIDLIKMFYCAKRIIKSQKIDIIHCRGYLSGLIGMRLSKIKNNPFIFDIRGFYIEERIDGGIWNKEKLLYKIIIQKLKSSEKKIYQNAKKIVSLTEKGKTHIMKEFDIHSDKIGVISTCVNHNLFKMNTNSEISELKRKLGIDNKVIFIYSGALGSESYNTKTLISVFENFKKNIENAFLIILSKDKIENNIKLSESDYIILNLDYSEVNNYINIASYGFLFYNSGWSNIGRNPTKLGEYLATGLKTFYLGEIGDLDKINLNIYKLAQNDEVSVKNGIDYFNNLGMTKKQISENAFNYYDLNRGIEFYNSIYTEILNPEKI